VACTAVRTPVGIPRTQPARVEDVGAPLEDTRRSAATLLLRCWSCEHTAGSPDVQPTQPAVHVQLLTLTRLHLSTDDMLGGPGGPVQRALEKAEARRAKLLGSTQGVAQPALRSATSPQSTRTRLNARFLDTTILHTVQGAYAPLISPRSVARWPTRFHHSAFGSGLGFDRLPDAASAAPSRAPQLVSPPALSHLQTSHRSPDDVRWGWA
jgi:hypothetical protein